MFSGLFSLVGLAATGFYLYVAVAVVRMEMKAGATLTVALSKAVIWPVAIWSSIQKLYLSEPK